MIAVLLVANIVSVVLEAGFAWQLPDDPKGYLMLR
jgi:hypothetical protein